MQHECIGKFESTQYPSKGNSKMSNLWKLSDKVEI